MKVKGMLTPEIIISASKRMQESFGEPTQIIVNPNVDFSALKTPIPQKTPEEIEQERIKEALELTDLIRGLWLSFESYTISSSDYGYFITAIKYNGVEVTNTINGEFFSLKDAINDILEKLDEIHR